MAPAVLGLDLSIAATGWALDGVSGTWAARASDGDARLVHIRRSLRDLIATVDRVDLAVVEDLPTHANGAGITGMVHGVVRTALIIEQIPYALVVPASLKRYATGRGNAQKPDMRMELYKRAGIDLPDDNQVDAWWLAAAGLDHLGHPPLTLPGNHRAALAKVRWPHVPVAV